MRVELTRSGGFGGFRQTATADETTLAAGERDELLELVAAADLWSLPSELPGPAPSPDGFRYRIAAQEGDRRHEIRVAEEALPDRLRPLVRWLERRVGAVRR